MAECIEGEPMKVHKLLIVVAALLVAGIGDSWADRRVYGRAGVYVGPGPYWGGAAYGRPFYPRPFYPRSYYSWPYYSRPYYSWSYYSWPGYPGPYLYADPYYAPAVVVPPEPQVYIERSDDAIGQGQAAAQQYWYFCRGSNRYYPYVKECPGGWQRVLPQPGQ
jgi:hypothetical protein